MAIARNRIYWYKITIVTRFLDGAPVHRICLAGPPSIIGIGSGVHHPDQPHRWRMSGWCLHLYAYHADLIMAGRTLPIRPGFASVAPPQVDLDYRFQGRSQHISVHFTAAAGPVRWEVGAMIDLESRRPELERALHEAAGWWAVDPLRARVRLWDILLGLARPVDGGHPLVEQARGLIEQRLQQEIQVEALARELGCSHNHLTGLFRRELRSTVVGWVRRRRAQQAHHLLISTSMPIAAIAREVGIPDPHHFNKVIRRELGAAPRHLRARGY
jgi:AraC family transcriptional regulator